MELAELDRRLLVAARTRGHSAGLDRVVGAFSKVGEHAFGWLALGSLGALIDGDARRRECWRRGVLTVAGAYVANQALKFTVRRRRPQLPGLPPLAPTVSQLSFPSAHSTTSFAAVQAYGGLVPAWLLLAVGVAVGWSRPYLGVHYPSDVVAGAALGTLVGRARRRRGGGGACR